MWVMGREAKAKLPEVMRELEVLRRVVSVFVKANGGAMTITHEQLLAATPIDVTFTSAAVDFKTHGNGR